MQSSWYSAVAFHLNGTHSWELAAPVGLRFGDSHTSVVGGPKALKFVVWTRCIVDFSLASKKPFCREVRAPQAGTCVLQAPRDEGRTQKTRVTRHACTSNDIAPYSRDKLHSNSVTAHVAPAS